MKKSLIGFLGIVLLLCLLCTCSFWGGPGEEVILEEEEVLIHRPTEEAEKEDVLEEEEALEEEEPEELPPAPIFLYWKTVSETEIIFGFSQPVTVVGLNFSPDLESNVVEEGCTVRVSLMQNLEPDRQYIADIEVMDAYENTINRQIPFRLRISPAPVLQINELRTLYSGTNSITEFIEFKMLSTGNLGGVRVFVASNKNPVVFEFEPVEVNEEEYVVLHMRILNGEEALCKNEYGSSLDESGGTDSSPTARDFWVPGSNKLLRNIDAVYVLDQDDCVLDAIMITETPDSQWSNDLAKAAEFLYDQGAWKSPVGAICTPADAVNSTGIKTAATRSISRDETAENTHTAADWYVTANNGVTPGKENNLKRL
jgi:hypothetical protein